MESAPHATLAPSPWIVRFAHLVDPAVLDNLASVPGVEARALDLESGAWPLARERFEAIVVTNYLHRPLLLPMLAALASDGTLLYETFAAGNEAFGRPANPDFLLLPGELLTLAQSRLTVVAFEQGRVASSDRQAVVQRLAAVGLARSWPSPLDDS